MAKETVAIATPSLGVVSIFWARCWANIIQPNFAGMALFCLRDGVGGEIAETRNGIVDAVLQHHRDHSEISHILWIDDDVIVQPGVLLELLHQSKKFDVPIVNGTYFQKMPGNLTTPLIYPEPGGGADFFRPDEVYEVFAAGMGLTLVRREVYERMAAELPLGTDRYVRPRWYYTSNAFEDTKADDKGVVDLGWTEDTWFYQHAREMGLKVLVDTCPHALGFHISTVKACIKCGLEPGTKTARECPKCKGPLSWLDKGYPTRQWDAWVNGEKIVWSGPGGVETVWE
jgi:hypothetical protein